MLRSATRALAERGNSLLKTTFKALRRVSLCPWRIGDITTAALVLLHIEHGRTAHGPAAKATRLGQLRLDVLAALAPSVGRPSSVPALVDRYIGGAVVAAFGDAVALGLVAGCDRPSGGDHPFKRV